MVNIYGIKNCDSVKKGLKFLDSNKIEYNFIDFKKTPQSTEIIKKWCGIVGIDILLNKRGATYKMLSLKDKNLTTDELIALMAENNLLIKRPIIEFDNQLIVGYDTLHYQGVFQK